MDSTNILNEIKRFVLDNTYCYALLIDGEWGSGKTWFVKTKAIPAIEQLEREEHLEDPREVKYLSLYGIKSIEEIQQQIYWVIINEKIRKKVNQVIQTKERPKLERTEKIISVTTKKIINTFLKLNGIADSARDLVQDTLEASISLSKYIFVFDDLERTSCSINDVLGYLNTLVEQEEIKVILVANEKEIEKVKSQDVKALQYLVAEAENLHIELPKGVFDQIRGTKQDNSGKAIDLDKLEARTNTIFGTNRINKEYERIKEKLIGVTVRYYPETEEILEILIDKNIKDDLWSTIIKGKTEFFSEVMKYRQHTNLRTFQFFLSKCKFLLNSLPMSSENEAYKEELIAHLIEDCFYACIDFKCPEHKNASVFSMYYPSKSLKSVREYVIYSILDCDLYSKEVYQYIDEELKDKLQRNDSLVLLRQNWCLYPQEWVEEQMDNIIKKLEAEEYAPKVFHEILTVLSYRKEEGFSQEYVEKAKYLMSNYIDTKHICEQISTEGFYQETVAIKAEVDQFINELNTKIADNAGKEKIKTFRDILNRSDWATELETIVSENQDYLLRRKPFLENISSDMWIDKLKNSEPLEIQVFRKILRDIYTGSYVNEISKKDLEILSDLRNAFSDLEDVNDLIVKIQLQWLCKNIDSYIGEIKIDV